MKVQCAIDTTSRAAALDVADAAAAAGISVLEVGHVLVKIAGLGLVGELRRRHPEAEVVADMKTMDMGWLEVETAARAGAHSVIVCGAASDGVLRAARDAGAHHGVDVLVSLMGVRRRRERTEQLLDLGLTHVIAHRGIDDRFLWSDPDCLADLEHLAALPGVRLALAGGIDPVTFGTFAHLPLDRVIVGRGIIEAPVVAAAAAEMHRLAEESERSRRDVAHQAPTR